MSVKRYDVNGSSSVFEDDNGSLVDYDDYLSLEVKLDESLRYGRQADATIHNLELQLTYMAVQLANAESKCRELSSKAMELVCEASLVYSKYNDTQMPDRDLVDMQTLQEMHDLCKGAAL